MSAIQTYFQDFLTNIRLPDSLKKALISAHTELREQLKSDDLTKDLLVESFLQGSYARSTCIKPAPGKKVDVDVIVVTNIDHDTVSAQEAFAIITPFVKKYYQNYEQQKRSIGISLPEVDMDLVITAAPSEEVKRAIECAGLSSAFTVDDLSGYQQSLLENYRLDSLERLIPLARIKYWRYYLQQSGSEKLYSAQVLLDLVQNDCILIFKGQNCLTLKIFLI